MATYSHHGSSEIQGAGDGLQTLILMSPAYVGYSETQPQAPSSASNLVFLNSNSSGNSTLNHSHHLPSATQYLAGIPLQQLHGSAPASAASFQDSQNQDVSELHGLLPQLQYSLQNPIGAAREATRYRQGLSLSLSSQQPPGYRSVGRDREDPSQPLVTAKLPPGGEDVRVSRGSPSRTSNSMNCAQSELLTAKYLKAAQELLDEVVNVGKGAKSATKLAKEEHGHPQNTGESSGAADGGEQSGAEAVPDRGIELTAAEKQEIQMKKAKLVNMLDEVEQQYWQYRHQMQIVISWFDQAAGIGSAKTYTALALQTISKQFRCLKDAIMGQIQAACKNLGEEDGLGGKTEGSRLKYVDNEFRQPGSLQQLGMIRQSTWRSQRGLPERSVSVLRAWLFNHFLHPYPKDSDKVMLAKQTGLSRSQVSNWFINARVRLWKPMIEEMHAQEMKEVEGQGSEDERSGLNEVPAYKSPTPESNGPAGTKNQDKSYVLKQDSPINHNIAPVTSMSTSSTYPAGETMRKISLIGSSGMESITQGSPKKQCNAGTLHSPSIIPSMNMESQPTINFDKSHMSMKFGNQRLGIDGFTLMGAPTDFIGGFSSYPVVKLGRFGAEQYRTPYSGNHVSLTLGLPHEENLSMSRANQTFLPNQNIQLGRGVQIGEANEFSGMNTPTSTHSTSVYENINIQNPKTFDSQLLPDFVA